MRRTSPFATPLESLTKLPFSQTSTQTDIVDPTFRFLAVQVGEFVSDVTSQLQHHAVELSSLREALQALETDIRQGLSVDSQTPDRPHPQTDSVSISMQFKTFVGAIQHLHREVDSLRSDRDQHSKHFTELEKLKSSLSTLTLPLSPVGFKELHSVQTLVPTSGPLSDGIISHLTKLHGGNVCDGDHPRVRVFSSSVDGSAAAYAARNAVDLTAESRFLSANQSNQWITYDFNDNQSIKPTAYTLRSTHCCNAGCCQPRNWVIEVTNDPSNASSWIEIDRRANNSELNGMWRCQNFQIAKPPIEEFRAIRMRQIGINHRNNHYLCISAFEVFGQLRIREPIPRWSEEYGLFFKG